MMFKHILAFAFLINTPIYCGNWWARPSRPLPPKTEVNPYEPLQKELSVYLEGLNLDDITTISHLHQHLHTNVNQDIWDKAKFPAFNTLWQILRETNDYEKGQEVRMAQMEVIRKFVAQKIATSPTIQVDTSDENLED